MVRCEVVLFLVGLIGIGCGPASPSTPTLGSSTGGDDDDDDDDGNDVATNGPPLTSGTSGPDPATDDSGEESTGRTTGLGSTTDGEETSEGSSGGAVTTSDSNGAGACGELEACCDAIGADLYAACMTVVDMGSADLCDSILGTYHAEGYCTGEPYCEELGACCSELPPGPGWQDTCGYYADLGNQPQCLMLIGDYQLSGYCD